ncbi:2'-5' RNA ligase family protein [Streptomyces sp. DSM 42041]|uniref:2'-5' RNA ligase family protein n=1 Tax=Streptomyces hazeniae TaxID=3075538 RepID=A0ABU2NUQ6_9ACTN|nr:2'-5' RNA ligase family protein [Streptomyces sp. DSM 42041]MDT0380242.1 2'-5' RNA ligase family protein [Streptomyces sp. DSM 42041]
MSRTVDAFVALGIPSALVDALVELQQECRDRVTPQHPEHLHITLAFLHGADEQKLADVHRLIERGAWPAPAIRLTGEVRHGSWSLRKDPSYRYDDDVVQKDEQVRLGIGHNQELAALQEEITQRLGITEDGFWPHVTLGLAREDFPVAEAKALELPAVSGPAPCVDARREVSATEFTTLVRKDLMPA